MPRIDLAFDRGLQLTQASDFTFVDDATPSGIDDSTGSVGAMTVNFDRHTIRPALMKQLAGQAVKLSTAAQESRSIGRVSGNVSGTDSGVSISIDSIAVRLAVKRNAKPFIGRLDALFVKWAALVSIPAANVVVDSSIAAQQVAVVGFSDNLWVRMKLFCAAVGIEVVVSDDTLVVRPPRAVVVNADRIASKSWQLDDSTMAQSITVDYYLPQNVVAGDTTPDYSRSNVSSDPDDPGAGLTTANDPSNMLPPGYTKRIVNSPT